MAPAKIVAKPAAEQTLRLFQPNSPAAALGLAVSHLMTKPAFAKLQFGDWSRILVGQINRKHFCFVVDGAGQVQGFMGWALASEEHAQGRDGDCVVVNAFSANSTRVTRFLVEEARRVFKDKSTINFKRHYKDVTTRVARVSVNNFIGGHIERTAERRAAASAV